MTIPLNLSLRETLRRRSRKWLVTGVAGFIGSHLLEALISADQEVVGLDNFSTGRRVNLDDVRATIAPSQWARFKMMENDIRDIDACRKAVEGVEIVLHQAALGSVPRSIENPLATNEVNVSGTLNVLKAASEANVRRVVFASSSSVYGVDPSLPKKEERTGEQLSPYAVSKYVDELYARVFSRCYGLQTIGLRYFNVFGPRQDPNGPYAAVIPRWIDAMLHEKQAQINGDGSVSRDFCYVANVVQMNMRAALTENDEGVNKIYNVALNASTSLNELFTAIRDHVLSIRPELKIKQAIHLPPRAGDIQYSQADISRATALLGYQATHDVVAGLRETVRWYTEREASGR